MTRAAERKEASGRRPEPLFACRGCREPDRCGMRPGSPRKAGDFLRRIWYDDNGGRALWNIRKNRSAAWSRRRRNTLPEESYDFDNAYAEYLNDEDDGYDDIDDEDEEYFGLSM